MTSGGSTFFRILMTLVFIFPQFAMAGKIDSEKPSFMKDSAFPELPTYYQLMQLDEKTRTEYIKGVVSLMDYVERRKEGFDSRPSEEAFVPARVKNFLEMLLKTSTSPADAGMNCVGSCPAGYDMVNSSESNYCMLSKCPEGTKDSGTLCRMGTGCAYSCDRQCIAVANYAGTGTADQQKALQDALNKKAEELRKQREADAQKSPGTTSGGGQSRNLDGGNSNGGSSADGKSSGTSQAPVTVAPVIKAPDTTTPSPATPSAAAPATTAPASPGTDNTKPADPAFQGYTGSMTPEQQQKLKDGLQAEGQKRLKEKEEAKKCEPVTCPEQDGQYRFQVKKDFNARVTETGNANCINGGLISKYDVGGRQKCKPVQTLKLGNMTLKCKAGQTMCSPLLFGLQQDTPATPFCIQIGVEITKSCYDKSNGAEGAKKFWKNKDVTHEMLSDEWNKLRDALKDLCVETRSAQYHCVECAVIAKRLKELNKIADKCPEQNSCGQKIECSAWKRIKGLDDDATGGSAAAAGKGATPAPAPGAATPGAK